MSEARAMAATARCRELVDKANTRHAEAIAMGIKPRQGLEPLDVTVKFNRAGGNTVKAFQVVVQMKLSLDGSGQPPFTDAAGLVGQGKTEAEALEQFFNWMADDDAVTVFRETVLAHQAQQLDVLAQAELAKKRAQESKIARGAEALQQNWAERKFDQLARKMGLKDKKIQA
jgi:hypothetical protein